MSEIKGSEKKENEKVEIIEGKEELFKEYDKPRLMPNTEIRDNLFSEKNDIFDEAFEALGLTNDTNDNEIQEKNELENDKEFSEYLDKGSDGKYYDKETGKSFESVEDWIKAMITLYKKYIGTANFYAKKAQKEWARFKNADQNNETEKQKWDHYQKSQKYYALAKECKEKADKIKEKLNSLGINI